MYTEVILPIQFAIFQLIHVLNIQHTLRLCVRLH